MQLSDKHFRKERPCRAAECGNVLFIILIAIAILAMLTYAISENSQQQSGVLSQQTSTDQINRMLTYAGALGGALQQMQANGENAGTLCTAVDITPPASDATFNTPPSNLKLYHPLGGGITYMTASSPDSTAVATSYNINPGSSITGVGCTAGSSSSNGQCTACTGHLVFTALISSSSYCAQINQIINGSTAVPVMNSGTFATLFKSSGAVAVTSANCASCASVARLCVTDGGGNYGFYADLFPPQWSNSQ